MKQSLSEIFEFIRNGKNIKQKSESDGLPITRIETISNSEINIEKVGYAGIVFSESEKYLLKDGDILFSHINSIDHLGKCALYRKNFGPLIHGMNLLCFRPKKNKLYPEFAVHLLRSDGFRRQFDKLIKKAINQASVSASDIKNIELNVPSITEQKRIAKLLNTSQKILNLNSKRLNLLDLQLKSILENSIQKCKVFTSINNVTIKKKINKKSQSNVWSLQLDQIKPNTGELLEKVVVDYNKLGSSTFYFETPVILYSKLRPYLNKVFFPKENGFATSELIPLYCDETKIIPEYLLTILRSEKFVEYANSNTGGAKMPRVIMDKFWSYKFPLLELKQQKKFKDIFSKIETKKKRIITACQISKNLKYSLQNQVFN